MTRGLRGLVATVAVFGCTAGLAQAASPDAVIGEVYGGGGNSGATLTTDFVELANRSQTAVDVGALSVQYLPASASPSSRWQATPLEGELPAGGRYLVAQARGNGGSQELPTPDATGTIALSATAGTVALVRGAEPLTCKTAADCAADGRVVDLVGYGSAAVREGTPTPATSARTSAARKGSPPVDTDDNAADFEIGEPTPTNSGGSGPVEPEPETATVEQVQGTGFRSPLVGQRVAGVKGVVTALRSNGYYIQQVEDRDEDPRTSPGLFIFTSDVPPVLVGQALTLTGTVSEYRPANAAQSTTQLTATEITAMEAGTLPPPEPLPPVPTGAFASAAGDTEAITSLQPEAAALDFWESREGTLVTSGPKAQVIGPTSRFNETIVLLRDGATPRTVAGGLAITPTDFNPERVKVEGLVPENVPVADVGDSYGKLTGVVDHDFNVPTIYVTEPTPRTDGGNTKPVTDAAGKGELAAATLNVENLSPADKQSKFDALAEQVTVNLAAPDIVALEEVQDNSGPANDGTVAADKTLGQLVTAIKDAGGPQYEWRQIDPENLKDGGQPGGNIRLAFLFRTDRGLEFIDRAGGDATTPVSVEEGPALSASPGRIDPRSEAFERSRKPLAGEFRWQGEPLFVVANHFNAKGGDEPLFGRFQPPGRPSEVQRRKQATAVRGFVDAIQQQDKDARVVVLGDLNDFEFSEAVDVLTEGGALLDLPRTLPASERYTYIFEGNSQVLDHILLSPGLYERPYEYEIVHANVDFADQVADHDPQVVRLGNPIRAIPPRLRFVQRVITERSRTLRLLASCPRNSPRPCSATATAVAQPSGKTVGAADFTVRPGRHKLVRLRLDRARLRGARYVELTVRTDGKQVGHARVKVLRGGR